MGPMVEAGGLTAVSIGAEAVGTLRVQWSVITGDGVIALLCEMHN